MKGEVRRLLKNEDAVAPVIGIVLVVAIAVVLATVIGAFVLGIGGQVSEKAPQASLGVESVDTTTNSIILKHEGADPIAAAETRIRVDIGSDTVNFDGETVVTEVSLTAGETANITTSNGTAAFVQFDGVLVYNTTATTVQLTSGDDYTITFIDRVSGQVIAEKTGTI